MSSDPERGYKSHIHRGFKDGEFATLPAEVRTRLIRLMARVSEASYRRGFQQGSHLQETGVLKHNVYDFRYKNPLSNSPEGTNGKTAGYCKSSVDRLLLEYRSQLSRVGLLDPNTAGELNEASSGMEEGDVDDGQPGEWTPERAIDGGTVMVDERAPYGTAPTVEDWQRLVESDKHP